MFLLWTLFRSNWCNDIANRLAIPSRVVQIAERRFPTQRVSRNSSLEGMMVAIVRIGQMKSRIMHQCRRFLFCGDAKSNHVSLMLKAKPDVPLVMAQPNRFAFQMLSTSPSGGMDEVVLEQSPSMKTGDADGQTCKSHREPQCGRNDK